MSRVLFVVKKRDYGYGSCHPHYTEEIKGGLFNSASYVSDMLNANGVESKLVEVVDNNDIDREVFNYSPDYVIIEAIWVIPEKFDVLKKLHPNVQWIVRGHSEIPFLSGEGCAINWLLRYVEEEGVTLAFNSTRAVKAFRHLVGVENVLYLPNYYPPPFRTDWPGIADNVLNVACFGAIRPLKNQLQQAVAAIRFAEERKQHLRFYINLRVDQGGESILKNIRALFKRQPHELIEVPWQSREEFLFSISCMDVGMQVSFSETYNITAADYTAMGLPMVVSPEIRWASTFCKANPNDIHDITAKLKLVTGPLSRFIRSRNQSNLSEFSDESQEIWLDYFQC